MSKRTGLFVWLAGNPRVVLAVGCIFALCTLVLSAWSGKWHWFPRGGALMALSGFIVSVQEALLYLAPRKSENPEYLYFYMAPVRTGPFGLPVFHPDMGINLNLPDPEMTQEEIEKEREDALAAWEEAEEDDESRILVKEGHPGHPGRPMRELSELTDKEYARLRLAAIFGVIGTFIWAFGDLLGGLPE